MTKLDVKWLSIELESADQKSHTWSDAVRASYEAAVKALIANSLKRERSPANVQAGELRAS
jgi:hypothetical protein